MHDIFFLDLFISTFVYISSSIANKLRSLLAQLDSSAEQDNLLSVSEWTIREHCDSLRQQVDIARETALESIHKASHTLIIEIDAYEQECLSRWTAAKESIEDAVKNLSERMREFVAKQHAFLQSQQASDTQLIFLIVLFTKGQSKEKKRSNKRNSI